MKATGIVRNLDELGRIVLPIELRRTFGVEIGEEVEIGYQGNQIIVKKYENGEVRMTRKVDKVGRIVIPKELRKMFDLQEGTPLEFFVAGDVIAIKKYQPFGACAVTGEVLEENRVYAGITLSPTGKRDGYCWWTIKNSLKAATFNEQFRNNS